MGNSSSCEQQTHRRRSSAARRAPQTHTSSRPGGGRSSSWADMIPDQFSALPQVTHALRRNGLESCNLIVGIDFTKSNEWSGKRTFDGRCLHCIDDPSSMNPYEAVIDTVGKTLRDFDEDNVIPVYGFGDELTGDHSLFTFSETSDPKAGFPFEGIRSRYRQVVRNVTMAGPTSFAPIINQAVNIVSQTGEYHILVIIADGQVTRSVDIPPHAVSRNEKETIDAITYASNFPLSIIMVGVGDGPWESMIYFDNYLVHRRFDNFQFVEYHKIASRFPTPQMRETQFALQALMEIPDQYRVIKEMGYLGRGPGQLRSDMPRVEIFPSPLPPSPPAYHHSFNQYEESRPSQTNTPSAPTYSSSTVEASTVQGIPVAQAYQASATLNRQGSVAEAELARMQEELLCAICEDQRKNLVFQCGHETCERCGEFLDHCPICRQPIQVRIKRYG